VLSLVLAGCGRENFEIDAAVDAAPDVPGADHDGDGIANTVDICPAVFDPMQRDADNDGIGDNCDPRPALAGDQVAGIGLFSEDFGIWVPDTIANWSLADGKLRTTAAADATAARLTFVVAGNDPRIRIALIVDDYGTGGSENQVNVRIGSNTSGNWLCQTRDQGGRFSEVALFSNSTPIMAQPLGPLAPGQLLQFEMEVLPTASGCATAGISAGVGGPFARTTRSTITIEALSTSISLLHAVVYTIQ
jgi:hypothetical protein